MYSSTEFAWHDNSQIVRPVEPTVLDNSPLFFTVGSFDKGPEDLTEVTSSNFNLLYGAKMYFEKHGQVAIQAQNIINAGGHLLIKRVCAPDSTLANVVFVANVTKTETQKVNENGDPLYYDEEGNETTTASEDPVMLTGVSLKWEAKNITGCKTSKEVLAAATALLDAEHGVFPLIVWCDNGRGTSAKAIRLNPDYNTSKGMGNTFYSASVYEGTTIVESTAVTVNPNVVFNNTSYAIEEQRMMQVRGRVIGVAYEELIAVLAEQLKIEQSVLTSYDIVYGYTNKGESIPGFVIDAEGVDLNSSYGVDLKMGTDGSFGSVPIQSAGWAEEVRKVYAGEVDETVWDVDQYKISAVIDANYPQIVKNAIARFVSFREDCVYFRDFGLDIDSFAKLKAAYDLNEIKSKFIPDFYTSYEIKDPVTMKTIKVTMLYDMAEVLVAHFASSAHAPLAGYTNSFILRNAIKGTLSYVPIKTPQADMKQAVEDLKVNYCKFEGDDCVVQCEYTSQLEYTELSYLNNVIAIQEVMRAIRTKCPKIRFTQTNGFDFSGYAREVENVLANFTGNFSILRFTYTKDKLAASQKQFKASIEFAFNEFAQSEYFDLFAINNEE